MKARTAFRMITLKELIKNYDFTKLDKETQDNLTELLIRVNAIRTAWGRPMTVTSGYRSKEDHIRIYKDIAAKKGVKFDISKVPMGSQHLRGAACDIFDPDLKLTEYLKAHPDLMKDVDLYCEDKNKNWVHFQIFPPLSGKRWFLA